MTVKEFIDYLLDESDAGRIDHNGEIWCEHNGESGPIEGVFEIQNGIIHVSREEI